MYEFTYAELSPQQKDAYLARIGCSGLTELTKETLDTLIYRHQCTVPFENLDVYAGKPVIPLDRDSLFSKIVERRRGGFCFELNGLFVLLLRAMGFDAVSCVCRVASNRTVLGSLTHRATIVRLNGRRYLCDVGLGGAMPPFAVEFSPEKQTLHGETFWIEPTFQGWYLMKRINSEGQEVGVEVIAPLAFLATDFEPLCQALISSPASRFRTVRIVNLRREDGSLGLCDQMLTLRKNGEAEEIPFTEEEYPAILKDYFHIIL